MLFTALISTAFNIAGGFIAGLLLYAGMRKGILKVVKRGTEENT
jgi:hypothetical protein